MRTLLIAALLAAPLSAAERSPFPALPGTAAVHRFIGLEQAKQDAKAARAADKAAAEKAAALAGREMLGMDVHNWSGGDISIRAPFVDGGIDVRMYRPFQRDGDYNVSGNVGRESVSGQAHERFRGDPKSGYSISGFGYNAWLDPFGRDWRLSGSADVVGKDGRKQRVSFNAIIDRVWSDGSEWRISTFGLDANIRTTSWSARIDGTYDPAQFGPMPLAVVGMAVGLINQERLRQDPRRP